MQGGVEHHNRIQHNVITSTPPTCGCPFALILIVTSRDPPSFPEGGSHAHAADASSHKDAAPVDVDSVSGGGDSPDTSEQVQHRSRRREDSGGAGGEIGGSGGGGANVDGNVVAGKSSPCQCHHRGRGLESTRSSLTRDKTVRRSQHD